MQYIRSMLLVGASQIRKHCRLTLRTLRLWSETDAFPLSLLPDGRYFTTSELIDAWAMARRLKVSANGKLTSYRQHNLRHGGRRKAA